MQHYQGIPELYAPASWRVSVGIKDWSDLVACSLPWSILSISMGLNVSGVGLSDATTREADDASWLPLPLVYMVL